MNKLINKDNTIKRTSFIFVVLMSSFFIFSSGTRAEVRASNNEVADFILQNFSDPTVQGSILRSEGAQFETTAEGIKLKNGYLGSGQSKEALKPAEVQALEAVRQRELENSKSAAGSPEFIFSKNIKDGYAIRYAGKTIRMKHAGGRADASFEPSALVYKNAYANTDILYFLGEGMCQEMILLRSEKSPSKFVYDCKLEPGGKIEVNEKGEITAGGLSLSKPVIFDSSGKKIEGRYEKTGGGIVLAFNPDGLKYPILIDPTWRAAGSISTGRNNLTATLLPNGKILIVGGGSACSIAELYDPLTGTFSSTGSLSTSRYSHTATLLPNGKVLIAGGSDGVTGPISSAELYDPSTGTFTSTGPMASKRYKPTATLLNNGKVLVTGGMASASLSSAEVYDPTSGTFSSTGPMTNARNAHTATLLPSGKVLIAGGVNVGNVSNAELYDPTAGTFSSAGTLVLGRYCHTATLLPNGKVLLAGGLSSGSETTSAELYDPSAGTFTSTGSLSTARGYQTATLLPNGKVLVAGGFNSGAGYTSSVELYDPSAGTFSSTGSLLKGREFHTATLLPDGKVLIAGGYASTYVISAEVYDPSVGTFSATGSMPKGRKFGTATLLPNGKVLLTGGWSGMFDQFSSADLYDPSAKTFSSTGSMSIVRSSGHTATLLTNGKVLVAGGTGTDGWASSTAELYDPTAKTFSSTGNMTGGRAFHTATLLPNGKVLIAAGEYDGIDGLTSANLYDPSSGTFTSTGPLSQWRNGHSATLLPNGKVLIAGGYSGSTYYSGAELYDPSLGTFSSIESMKAVRSSHTATLLPNGKVLIAGGYNGSNDLSSAELYDPTANTFSSTGSMTTTRAYHTATLLPNGKVLVAAGCYSGSAVTSSADLYDPSTGTFSSAGSLITARAYHIATLLPSGNVLIAAGDTTNAELVRYTEYDYTSYESTMRPSISTFPSTVSRGQTYSLTGVRFKGTSEASGGGTNAYSPTNYPRVYLQFMDSGAGSCQCPSGWLKDVSSSEYPIADWQNADTSISFTTPADLPAGYYLLTVMASAVPSDAKIIVCTAETLPPPPAPSAPTGFIGTAESTLSIRWSWNDVAGEDGYYLHNASHEVKGATAANITNTLEAGLSANTQYTRHVNAYNSGGSADSSSYSRYTWASAPTGLATIELTSSSAKLSWAGNGTRYAVERATQEAGPWTYIATWENGIGTTEYTDTGLASSTIYWYRARAYNGDQVVSSPGSAISTTTPAAASSYTTKVGSNEEWSWKNSNPGDKVPSGTIDDWFWRTWTHNSGRKVPSGEARDWTWGDE